MFFCSEDPKIYNAKGRVGSSEVTYVGAFFFRSSYSNLRKVVIGHVASPFIKGKATRAYTVPGNVLMNEYPLETFDGLCATEIKDRGFFQGINAWEQGALGLILHTARDYQLMCNAATPENLENQEHAALTDQIKRMLEKNANESRELAKKMDDEIKAQIQILSKLNETRLRSGPDRDAEFVNRISSSTITDPLRVFSEKIEAPPQIPPPPLATTGTPMQAPPPAPSSYTQPLTTTDTPNQAPLPAPNSYTQPLTTTDTPIPSQVNAQSTYGESLTMADSAQWQTMLARLSTSTLHGKISDDMDRVLPPLTNSQMPTLVTHARKATPIQGGDRWKGSPPEVYTNDILGRKSVILWNPSPLPMWVGLPPLTPITQGGAHEGAPTPLGFINFDQTRTGNHEHVRVLSVMPILRRVTDPRLQDPGLRGHVVARLKVHPVPLAYVIMRHETKLRVGSGRRVGGHVSQSA